jgi:hypothetical protein
MASNCDNCGAALAANQQICPSCGVMVPTVGATAAFVPPTAIPPKSGSSTLKIVLIVVAVIFGLGILGMGTIFFVGYRIAKNMHIDPNGQVTMSTPGGTVVATPAENLTAADLGVDIYPGAESTHGGMRTEMPSGSMVQGVFVTSDSPEQVVAFYKDRLGSTASVSSIFGISSVRARISPQESIHVTITSKSSQNEGKTRITIMRMKNDKAS